jgi:hypothetical protein
MRAMSVPARRCFIHVGSPKTGTSYLQSALWASKPSLAEQGLTLPLRPVDHFHLTLRLRGLLNEAMDPPRSFDVLERFATALDRSDAERVLISHELLAPVEASQAGLLHDILTDFQVHVLITARDLARQVPAEWQQSVKHRAKHTYADFLSDVVERRAEHFWAVQDVADIAARWRGSVPAERVHVVTVPQRSAPPGTLLARFCSVLEVDPERLTTRTDVVNPSMGAQQAELLRRVNVALGDRLPHPRAGYARVAKNHLGDKVLATQPGIPLRLPTELNGWAREAAGEMVARIASEGYDVVGDLDELVPGDPGDAQPGEDGSHVSEDAVSQAAVEAIAALLDQRHQDLEEIRELRTAVRASQRPPVAPPQPTSAEGQGALHMLRFAAQGLAQRVFRRDEGTQR